jgi:hypothetical protein
MKNILIGNGVNFNSDCDLLTNEKIKSRFIYFSNLFIDDIKQEELKQEVFKSIDSLTEFTGNIEEIAAKIYKNVENNIINKIGYFSGNHEQRLKGYLKRVALNAIFKEKDNRIFIDIKRVIVQNILRYNTILSLNYYEFWDDNKRSKHLHGNIDFDGNEILNIDKCVFSPLLNIQKSKSDALYPSDHLAPSDDLYLMDEYTLYKEFENINELDVFGVSPIGDKELMEALNKIEKVKIYVYDLNSNIKELDTWQKILNHAEYLDSKYF